MGVKYPSELETDVILNSKDITNAIRATSSGVYRNRTNDVETDEDLQALGKVVLSDNQLTNEYAVGMWNLVWRIIFTHKNFENDYAKFKKGEIDIADIVENVAFELINPQGYEQSRDNPGEVFATHNPNIKVETYATNVELVYPLTITRYSLSKAFRSFADMDTFISTFIATAWDSHAADEKLMTRYVLARAALDNWDSNTVTLENALTKDRAVSDAVLSTMKQYSNEIVDYSQSYNVAHISAHSPKADQTFWLTAKSASIIDIYSLAAAMQLKFDDFMGAYTMVRSFSFNTWELNRIDNICAQMKTAGFMPDYEPFTDAELAKLERIEGAILDRDFFMIFDRDLAMEDIRDPLARNTNMFLHVARAFYTNSFANAIFFVSPAEEPTPTVVATPVITGETPFAESTTATITCETEGATIYYTVDGTDPTAESTEYTNVITLSSTITIKAIAILDDTSSEIASKTFTKSE